MLSEVALLNFKCFESVVLPLAELTILSGTNGGGKSSVIQSLLLIANSIREREWADRLLLDGPELALGSAVDVLYEGAARRRFGIAVGAGPDHIGWFFEIDDRRALSVPVAAVWRNGVSSNVRPPLRWLLPVDRAPASPVVEALRHLSWISAERTGPREILPVRDSQSRTDVGPRGEYAAGLILQEEDRDVRAGIRLARVPPTLFNQVRARMQEFFPGCDLRVQTVEGTSSVSLRLRSAPGSEFQRPQNVGFGLTQLLPIVVALVAAREGDCLLIENPEVHLHPRAQQQIGALLAQTAASGVQVIVETHSDHVLNGVRLAVRRKAIAANQVAMHFFSQRAQGAPAQPKSPKIDSDGRISDWPEGFFDQFDLALAELL